MRAVRLLIRVSFLADWLFSLPAWVLAWDFGWARCSNGDDDDDDAESVEKYKIFRGRFEGRRGSNGSLVSLRGRDYADGAADSRTDARERTAPSLENRDCVTGGGHVLGPVLGRAVAIPLHRPSLSLRYAA